MHRQASECIQGEMISNDPEPKPVERVVESNYFQPLKMELRTPGKHKLKYCEHEGDAKQICHR